MTRRVGWLGALSMAFALAAGGCKKEEAKKDDKRGGEEKTNDKGGDKGGGSSAKPTKEDCQKLAQHQIDIEKDPSMKSALQSSMDGLVEQCMTVTKTQVDCMMSKNDGAGFADCLMQ